MKKVLIIHNKYRIFGGEDSNIIDEISHLKQKYSVEYLEFDNSEKIKFYDIIGFILGKNFNSNNVLNDYLDFYKPDIVYIHNLWFKANLDILNILLKKNIKVLFKLHNFRYDCARHFLSNNHLNGNKNCNACSYQKKSFQIFNKYYQESFFKSFFLILFSKRLFKIMKNENLILLVLTNFHKQHLVNLGVNSNKIKVYSNPIPLHDLNNSQSTLSNNVIYAGRINSEKGIEELINSWIRADLPNFKLKIIGDGEILDYLNKKYTNKNIVFLGELTHEKVLEEIKNSKAVVSATKMYEGQPRLLCEASSLGIASIYPSFGGMDEFFPDNYELSFEQFNYEDLTKKLLKIQNSEFIFNQGLEALSCIKIKLNPSKLLHEFDKILEGYE